MNKKHLANFIFAVAVLFSATVIGNAQFCLTPGCLDSTFGSGGMVFTQINPVYNWAQGVAIQPFDGKLVVAVQSANPYPAYDSYVVRYDANGLLDPTFGNGGVVNTSFTGASDNEGVFAVAVQTDGKIIVVGNAPLTPGGSIFGFAVSRLNPNGTFDPSFDLDGKVLFNFASNVSAVARDVVIQPNGAIVIAGLSSYDFAVARLTPTGAFDTSFNGSGRVTIRTSNFAEQAPLGGGAKALAIQPLDGKIVLVGHRPPVQQSGFDFAVIRLNYNGTLDNSFGNKGQVYTDFFKYTDGISDVVIDSSNKIVVAGRAETGTAADLSTTRFALARYLPNGQLDSTFGSGGKVIGGVQGTYSVLSSLSIQGDGKLITSGSVGTPNPAWAVARFNPNGSPDTFYGFNGTGIVLNDFPGGYEMCDESVLDSYGRLVGVGNAGSLSNIALARYLP